MGDYHIHLHPHGAYDGTGPEPGTYPDGHIEAYVEAAAARGVQEVGFTEHWYRCVESAPVLGDFWEDDSRSDLADLTAEVMEIERNLSIESYVDAIVGAKDRGLPVLLGLEVDFFPESIEAVMDFLGDYPWDFLIGSVHWIGAWGYDRNNSQFEFDRRGTERAYEEYFSLEEKLAASGSVDVLAHADAVKKKGRFLSDPPVELYENVVAAAVASGTAVEINTSGWWHIAEEVFPHPAFLQMFHDAGVPITLASDAHRPEFAGRGFDRAAELARTVGYTHCLQFRDRVATEVPLPSFSP